MKIASDYDIQHKNWKNLEIMKNIFQNHRQISVVWTQSNYFSVNSATDLTWKKHENNCNQSNTDICRLTKCLLLDWDRR